jgi:thioester reductase-like protein
LSRLDPDGTLLLTGATGFLGRHLAVLLGRRHRGRIIALVRAADHRRACDRLAAALGSGSGALSRDDVAEPTPPLSRCEVIVGDLTEPRLGLGPAPWRGLTGDVDAIIHSGAVVNLAAGLGSLRAANIGGTATILELALQDRPKLLHLISTLSVFVAARPSIAEPQESDELAGTESVRGGYAQSKWSAEVLAREVARRRLPLVCHRLGLLTGDTLQGVGPTRDQLTFFLRGLALLGVVPEGHETLRVDISPVDAVARALTELVCAGRPVSIGSPTTYHLASPNGASGADLVAALRRYGATIEPVSRQRWRKVAAGRSQRSPAAAVAYLALGRCLDLPASEGLRAYDLFQATGFRFDSTAADAQLGPRGLSLSPVTASLLDLYVAAALGGRP